MNNSSSNSNNNSSSGYTGISQYNMFGNMKKNLNKIVDNYSNRKIHNVKYIGNYKVKHVS